MTQVFLSYAREDHAAALPIIDAISQAGLKVRHPDAALLGDAGVQEVRHALDTAQCVVILWSEAATRSRFLQQELYQAIQAWSSDRLVLVALDDAPLPLGLRDLSAISIRAECGSGVKQLIERAQYIIRQGGKARSPSSNGSTPALHRARSARRRRFAAIVAASLIVGFAVLTGVAFMRSYLAQRYSEAEETFALARPAPPPPIPAPTIPRGPSSPFILTVLVFGASIGAAAAWVWIARSRRRSARALSGELSRQMLAASNDGPQVFVSYSRHDGPTVGRLVQQIEQLGYAVWIDRQSTGSQRYAGPIVHAIRMSRLVALMCSQNAFASDHVIREVYLAGDFKKPFIAFQLDAAEFPDEVLYFVSGFPRVAIATIDPQQLRSEIARLVAS